MSFTNVVDEASCSPADRLGVATLSAGVQRAGGSVQHPMSKLDDALESMAAYVEARTPSAAPNRCCRDPGTWSRTLRLLDLATHGHAVVRLSPSSGNLVGVRLRAASHAVVVAAHEATSSFSTASAGSRWHSGCALFVSF